MKHPVKRIAVAAALAFAATAVTAGEVILYEHQGFQGRRMTLHGNTSDFDRTQFNDRAESIVVRDGVWEVCTDAGFNGHCVRLQPGEYPNLDSSLNNRISSAREVAQYTPPPPRGGAGNRTPSTTRYALQVPAAHGHKIAMLRGTAPFSVTRASQYRSTEGNSARSSPTIRPVTITTFRPRSRTRSNASRTCGAGPAVVVSVPS